MRVRHLGGLWRVGVPLAWLLCAGGCSRSGVGVAEPATVGAAAARTEGEPAAGGAGSPSTDAASMPDAADDTRLPPGCVEEDLTIRVLSDDEKVYSFDPMTVEVSLIGSFDCGEALNSMSIAQNGDAYVASQLGGLFVVDLETLECTETPFDRASLSGDKFALGFVADADMEETLYITEGMRSLQTSERLSAIDLTDYRLRPIGPFPDGTPSTEITGTGDGRIFGLTIGQGPLPTRLVEIDPETVEVTELGPVPFDRPVIAFDFAFWGGAFYIFLSEDAQAGSTIIRIAHPSGEAETLGTVGPRIIGAGTSTCARQ